MPEQPEKPYRPSRRAILLTFCGVLSLVLAIAITIRPHQPPLPPIIVLPSSYTNPRQHIPIFARLVPPTKTWAWLWHIKEALFGKIRPVEIRADIVTLHHIEPLALANPDVQSPGTPGSPGLKIWLLEKERVTALRQMLRQTNLAELMSSPRLITGDGTDASMFVGTTLVLAGATNELGLSISCRPRIHEEVTDLTTFVTYLTARTNQTGTSVWSGTIFIQTNLDVKARFQIPNGKGIFLLQSSSDSNSPNSMGVVISAKL
jgi:hypothetical protein